MLGTIGAAAGAKAAAAAGLVVAKAPPGPKAPDAGGFLAWLTGNPVRIILVIVGIGVIVGANRGRLTKAVTASLIVIVGLFIMYGDTAMKGIATWIGSYFS